MLKALLIQRIFSIPTDTLLIVFLKYSQELRDFCGFDVVPDASKFTCFKQDLLMDLQSMFDHLVDLTEPICQKLDFSLASMTIFDTSGIDGIILPAQNREAAIGIDLRNIICHQSGITNQWSIDHQCMFGRKRKPHRYNILASGPFNRLKAICERVSVMPYVE